MMGLFAANGFAVAALCGIVAIALTWDTKRLNQAKESGRQEVRVETTRANDAARKSAARVRALAADGVRAKAGTRDPNSVD